MSTPPILVDQIIEARWIIPVEPDDTTLEHHSLVIQGERILDLLVEWHGDEIQRRAEAMIAAGQTLTAEDLVSITHEVARSFGRNRR